MSTTSLGQTGSANAITINMGDITALVGRRHSHSLLRRRIRSTVPIAPFSRDLVAQSRLFLTIWGISGMKVSFADLIPAPP